MIILDRLSGNVPQQVNVFGDDVMEDFDATEIAALVARGDIGVVELTSVAARRVERANTQLNALVTSQCDHPLMPQSGPSTAPFHGVPSLIKDNEDLAGVKTYNGSRATNPSLATKNSAFVDQYLSLGFSILGKTALPELGLTSTTEPLFGGATLNPWNLDYSPGGSSGGAAALVASGAVPIAHGNDGGGSIRTPASCCGLVGMKPTRGRLISTKDPAPLEIACHGVLTRTVRDTANFFAHAETSYRNPALPEIGCVRELGSLPPRIGFFTEMPNGNACDLECSAAAERAANLCERLGCHVSRIACPYPQQIFEDFELYYGFCAFGAHRLGRLLLSSAFDKSKLEDFTLGLSSFFLKNVFRFPQALKRLRNYHFSYGALFQDFDILLSPTNGMTPPRLNSMGGGQTYESVLSNLKRHACFNLFQNIAGAPAISLPMGFSEFGLPIGIQLAARWGQERSLLELGFGLESITPELYITESK